MRADLQLTAEERLELALQALAERDRTIHGLRLRVAWLEKELEPWRRRQGLRLIEPSGVTYLCEYRPRPLPRGGV